MYREGDGEAQRRAAPWPRVVQPSACKLVVAVLLLLRPLALPQLPRRPAAVN